MDRYLQSFLNIPSKSEGKEVVDWFKKISVELNTETL